MFAIAAKVLFGTIRRVFRASAETIPYRDTGDKRYIYSVWHDSAVFAAFGGKHPRTVALTSRHTDGGFVEASLKWKGVHCVRGSTGHGGRSAVRALMKAADFHIVITPDGPRGPRRKVSSGIAFLASRSGKPIVATSFRAVSCWRIAGSWTELTIPKPFTKVFMLTGDPIVVPPDATREELAGYTDLVQAEMELLDQRAAQLVADERIKPVFQPS